MLPSKEIKFKRTCPDSNYDVFSKEVDRVQELMELGFSPYRAWLKVLKKPDEDLSNLLGVRPKAAKAYLSTNTVSPHRINIRKMCDALGIHPAYLQPALRFESYEVLYHPSVLDAICDVLKDPEIAWEERAVSINALQVEKSKFEAFAKEYPERANFLMDAMTYMVTQDLKIEFPEGIASDFNKSVRWLVDDVERSLALYERHLQSEFHQSFRDKREKDKDAGWHHNRIIELADKLYGVEFSDECLDILTDKVLTLNPIEQPVPESFWAFCGPEILKEFSLQNRELDLLDAPTLKPDFNTAMRTEGFSAKRTKSEFIKLLPEYIEKRRIHINSSREHKEKYYTRESFAAWMEDKQTYDLDIPLYKNYCIAHHYLAKSSLEKGIEFNSVLARHWSRD